MSQIIRSGNLVKTPELRQGENGAYTYVCVAVTDRIHTKDGFTDGPSIYYDVQVSGVQAEELVECAKASGNVRVLFSGRYRVTEFKGAQGITIQHQVTADEIGISLRNQSVRAGKRNAQPVMSRMRRAAPAVSGSRPRTPTPTARACGNASRETRTSTPSRSSRTAACRTLPE